VTKPEFITFTGADDSTDVRHMVDLADQYPIEWGILFSPKRQGQGRYPSARFVNRVREESARLHLSAHLCGQHSRDLIERGGIGSIGPVLADGKFGRVQINTSAPYLPIDYIATWGEALGVRPILQCRAEFHASKRVDWLFDQSGGRGVVPGSWPVENGDRLVGYAGGLGPNNVATLIKSITAMRYWIDMESGVRDENDRFDLNKCRAVCEAVYGAPEA